jgi:hypothetical protein
MLALVLGATAGSALAEKPQHPATSPGNSGNAPGQEKKDQSATTTTTVAAPVEEPAPAAPGKSDSAPGLEKKTVTTTSSTTSASTASAAVKSSHTAADGSKQYGNGKSALEVAKQTKSSITIDDVSEPGNSGKHKVTICHNGHLITVDVHALKAHARHLDGSDVIPATSAAQCRTAGSTSPRTNQTQLGDPANGSATSGGANGSSASGGSAGSEAGTADVGGVAGISATVGSGQQEAGVPGIAATRVKGALPFTGFALWIAVLIGASLLIGGIALRRRSRGPLTTAT